MADPVIHVSGLRKSYGDVRAVRGVDLDVAAGEIFALLGPNGAGKTTTVEILEGYRTRDGGEVRVLGQDPGAASSMYRAQIGIVLQNAADLADLKVAEAVHHFAGYYPNPRDSDQVIGSVGLADKADALVRTLSGGQRRRLDVALGIIGAPTLLFLDEPTTGFDPEARRSFWDLIRSLRDDGTTIMLTTHYLDEAEALADRVGVIARGSLRYVDTPAQLGGRAEAAAVVKWKANGQTRTEQTDTPTAFVSRLAAQFEGEIPELAVLRPTLEDIYLQLVAHTDDDDTGARAPTDVATTGGPAS